MGTSLLEVRVSERVVFLLVPSRIYTARKTGFCAKVGKTKIRLSKRLDSVGRSQKIFFRNRSKTDFRCDGNPFWFFKKMKVVVGFQSFIS